MNQGLKRILLPAALLCSLTAIGCKSLSRAAIQASQSEFLSHFSLQKTITNTATPGLDCSKFGPGGGIGSSSGGIGSNRVSHTHSYSFSVGCEISESAQF